jgi:hypothetical protein
MASAKQAGTKKPEAQDNEGRKYLELLINASNQRNTWRSISMLLVVLAVALMWALVQTTKALPVRLITYEMATGAAQIEVGPSGEGAKEYLAHIAEADLKLFTDWMPDTVVKRFTALSHRMTPQLHSQLFVSLKQEGEDYKKARYHQLFHARGKQVVGNDQVRISGILLRYAGETEVMNQPVTYILEYVWDNGVPGLQAIYPEDLKKQKEEAAAAAKAAAEAQ